MVMVSLPARSATVRATFRQRCRRRPDQPSFSAALRNRRAAASSSTQKVSMQPASSNALASPWRCICRCRAMATRAATVALLSPSGKAISAAAGAASTSTCRSMRSSSGPDSLPW